MFLKSKTCTVKPQLLVLLLRDAKLLLWDAKVAVNVVVRLDAGDRGRCCYSCHCRHKVCSFFPHCLEGISTVAIGRGHSQPSCDLQRRSLKIACFKWIGEDAKDRRLVRSYVLCRDFDNRDYKYRLYVYFLHKED